ncbi:MAG: DUF3313 domain-containing protein, partial [Deltaproteobacteria bacterium]|nr:DUF3313 domain-containing protein [Deltaproteobacteria bacterium]
MPSPMNRTALLLFCLTAMLLLTACATTGHKASLPQAKRFLDGYYQKLEPGPPGGAKMRWFKPGADFAKYDKVMLEGVVFYFSPDSEDTRIDAEEMKEISDACNLAVAQAIQEGYPIVAQPGPDVIRIRFAITDLKQSRPVLSAVSTVIPVGLGISLVKKGTTDSWTGSGATKVEVMALDSMTNEVIAAAQDEKKAEFEDRFSK